MRNYNGGDLISQTMNNGPRKLYDCNYSECTACKLQWDVNHLS